MNTIETPAVPQYQPGQHAPIAITARYLLLSFIVVTMAVLTLLSQ